MFSGERIRESFKVFCWLTMSCFTLGQNDTFVMNHNEDIRVSGVSGRADTDSSYHHAHDCILAYKASFLIDVFDLTLPFKYGYAASGDVTRQVFYRLLHHKGFEPQTRTANSDVLATKDERVILFAANKPICESHTPN